VSRGIDGCLCAEEEKVSRLFTLAEKFWRTQRQKPWNLYYQEIAQRPDFPHKIGRSKELKSIIRTHGILPDLRGKFWQVNQTNRTTRTA
jgi:hypothetical protein